MRRIIRRDLVAAIVIAFVSGTVLTSSDFLRGLSLDLLTTLRWELFSHHPSPASYPVVVVAIDEETYQTPPFKESPTLTWTREIGRVLSAIVDGGARVVGFDVIFPTSLEQSEIRFGDEALGDRMKGFDRDYLRALRKAADAGKLVLGEIPSRDQPERPSPGQRFAVRQQSNIRPLHVYTDTTDEIIRRLPLTLQIDGKPPVPLMAVELASRALDAKPELAADGTMTLGGYRIPSAVPNTLTLNFRGGGNDFPTYSLADLRACVEAGNSEFFRQQFEGKVVILGTVLNYQDRKFTSMRFSSGLRAMPAPRCALPRTSSKQRSIRRTMAGVFVHATAVRDLMTHDAVIEAGAPMRITITVAVAVLAALATCVLAPLGASLACLCIILLYAAVAVGLFTKSLALPLAEPALAAIAAGAMTIAYRFVVADRYERFLRQSFSLYLAPQVIETMLMSAKMPALGGEMRNVTVFFSDVAGFSSIAEKLTAAELVTLMNEYLSAMTDIIERHGGYVDKYIGDSIVAVFGAPVDDPNHARNAVRAALQCRARLEELNRDNVAFHGYQLSHRIGLNSGEALVGNIGSTRRFNYTAMSDAVNVASRLEGANKYFGTSIMASDTTVAQTGTSFTWRELDAIRVKGRNEPLTVFEPLAEAGQETLEQSRAAAAYAEGLTHWRAREFEHAAKCFDQVAAQDPPSAIFSRRANELAAHPPPLGWAPVNTLEGK